LRRTRRPKKKRASTTVQLAQVVGLIILLTMILLFRDKISFVAGSVLGEVESPDLKKSVDVKKEEPVHLPAE